MGQKADVIIGLQWGDEGKGKIVDALAPDYDIIARFQGGPNAGHTIEFNGEKHVLHSIPSGIFHPSALNVIGNGVVIDPYILFCELEKLRACGLSPEKNLIVSRRAHLILPTHRLMDAAQEFLKGEEKIGSTLKGIAPVYTDKYSRSGLRAGECVFTGFIDKYKKHRDSHLSFVSQTGFDISKHKIDGRSFDEYENLWIESISQLKMLHLDDAEFLLNRALKDNKRILAEGAQGTMLDIDFGSYPFVTSSSTITAGVCSGLGIPPSAIGNVYGVFKAYCTRVGSGPFPTELDNEEGEILRKRGNEFGSTTGRPRRCGWIDLPALRYSIMLNGVTKLVMTKADVLDTFEEIAACTQYQIGDQTTPDMPFDLLAQNIVPLLTRMPGWLKNIQEFKDSKILPSQLLDYIKFVENQLQIPLYIISTGPDRTQILYA